MSYRQFQKTFRQLIASPTLGEPTSFTQRLNANQERPAIRELRKTKLLDVLKSHEFCNAVYRLSQKHRPLAAVIERNARCRTF